MPSRGVGSFTEYKKKASQPGTSILCSEVKGQGGELLLPSCLSHHDGWQPQSTSRSTHFLAEDASCPVHVTGVTKLPLLYCMGKAQTFCGKSYKVSIRMLFLVLPQKLITGRCGPRMRVRRELMVTQTNSHTFQ